MADNTPLLHLYPSDWPHFEAGVIGNREGLIALQKAISRALRTDTPVIVEEMANDGEGYDVIVQVRDLWQDQTIWPVYTNEAFRPSKGNDDAYHWIDDAATAAVKARAELIEAEIEDDNNGSPFPVETTVTKKPDDV